MGSVTHCVLFIFSGCCTSLSLSFYPVIDDGEDEPRNCTNKLGNCFDFDVSACTDVDYGEWMRENCCEICITATTQPKHQECTDLLTKCAVYGKEICSVHEYLPWVKKNCAKYCNKCECRDTIVNCPGYGVSICSVPEYQDWVKKNCPKTCGVCADVNGQLGSQGCVYNGKPHEPGDEWHEGCHQCRCVDNVAGVYCVEVCVKDWFLPVECKMSPAKPGKCCPTPTCQDGTFLTPPFKLKL